MADKLARAICFLEALDDAVEPFSNENENESWNIVMLIALARKELMDGSYIDRLEGDTGAWADHVRAGKPITDSDLYQQALNVVRRVVHRVQ